MNAHMTPTGRTFKPHQISKTEAEVHLHHKYQETLARMNIMNSKTVSKHKRVLSLSTKQKNMEGQDSGQMKQKSPIASNPDTNDFSNGVKVNFTENYHSVSMRQDSEDFMTSKFGVAPKKQLSQMQKDDVQRYSLSNSNATLRSQLRQPNATVSLTHQIFIKDAKDNAVLPIETQSNHGQQVRRQNDKLLKLYEVQGIGFKNYLEQEDLDKASVNDLLSTRSRANQNTSPKLKSFLDSHLNKSTVKESKKPGTAATSNLLQTASVQEGKRASLATIDSQKSIRNSVTGYVRQRSQLSTYEEENKYDDLKRRETRQDETPYCVSLMQGGVPPHVLQSNNVTTPSRPSLQIERLDYNESSYQSTINQTEGLSWKNSVEVGGIHILQLPQGSRPVSKSSMGRFIVDLLRHETKTVKSKHRMNNAQMSKSIDVSKKGSKPVINQDSVLIKHDFNAGRSKVAKNHLFAQQAQIRMQQLIAMLRDKVGTKVLDVGKLSRYDSEDDDQSPEQLDRDEKDKDSEKNKKIPLRKTITIESINFDNQELPKLSRPNLGIHTSEIKTPKRVSSPNDLVLFSLKSGPNQTENKVKEKICKLQFSDIEKKIILNLDKFKSARDISPKKAQKVTLADGTNEVLVGVQVLGGDTSTERASALKNGDYGNQRNKNSKGAQVARKLFHLQAKKGSSNSIQFEDSSSNAFKIQDLILNEAEDMERAKLRNSNQKQMHQSCDASLQFKNGANSAMSYKHKGGLRMINTNILTSVPRRGKMIDTQKYIRDSLQAYADNKYFAFTKPAQMTTSGGPNSPESKRRNLILGNFKTISHDRHFISPIAAPSTKFLNSGNSTGHANDKQAGSQMTSTSLNYDPIVPVKKRKSKNFRILKHRRVINPLETQTSDNPKLPENEFVSLVRENNDLREELANMVQVFEQYLKVASLKETIEHRENRRLWSDSPVDGGDVPNFKSHNVKGSSSTNKNSWDSLRQNQNGISLGPDDMKNMFMNTSQTAFLSGSKLKMLVDSAEKIQSMVQSGVDQEKAGVTTQCKTIISDKDPSRADSKKKSQKERFLAKAFQHKEGFFMNHQMPFLRQNEQLWLSGRHIRQQYNRNQKLDVALPSLLQEQLNLNQLSIQAANEHKTHNLWLRKIQALWEELDSKQSFNEIIRLEEQIKENKLHIRQLKHENIKENALSLNQEIQLINKARNKLKVNTISKTEKKLVKVQKRLKVAIERSAELNSWGFHSHIISHIVKCRILEDLIDCAQRDLVRPDAQVRRELSLMKAFQRQTWEDLNLFLLMRNQDNWRTWDNPRSIQFKKPSVDDTLFPVLATALSQKKTQSLKLVNNWTCQMALDAATHLQMAREMVQFINLYLGSSAWLTLSRVKQLRALNKEKALSLQSQNDLSTEKQLKMYSDESQFSWLQLTHNNQDMFVYPDGSYIKVSKMINPVAEEDPLASPSETTSRIDRMRSRLDEFEIDGNLNASASPTSPFILEQNQESERDQMQHNQQVVEGTEDRTQSISDSPAQMEDDKTQQIPQIERDTQKNKVDALVEGNQQLQLTLAKQQSEKKDGDEIKREKLSWMEILQREREENAKRKKREEEARAKRLARLFADLNEDDSDDEELINANLDRGAVNNRMGFLLDKVDVHLQVEMNILRKWNDKDMLKGQKDVAQLPTTIRKKSTVISPLVTKRQRTNPLIFEGNCDPLNESHLLQQQSPIVAKDSIDAKKRVQGLRVTADHQIFVR